MFSTDDYIKLNDTMWQRTMNKLMKCRPEIEPTVIYELEKLNAERTILEKAKLYDGQHGR